MAVQNLGTFLVPIYPNSTLDQSKYVAEHCETKFLLIIFQPEATSGLTTLVNILFGLFGFLYFVLALVALVHNYIKATTEERDTFVFHFMLYSK